MTGAYALHSRWGLVFSRRKPPFSETARNCLLVTDGHEERLGAASVGHANDLSTRNALEVFGEPLLELSDPDIHVSTLTPSCGHVNDRGPHQSRDCRREISVPTADLLCLRRLSFSFPLAFPDIRA